MESEFLPVNWRASSSAFTAFPGVPCPRYGARA